MPTAGVSDHCIGAFRSPGARVVFERASRYLQSRFDNAPRRFDGVLSCEQHPVAAHGVADQALVCIYPSAAFVAAIELDVPTDHGGSSRLGSHADRDRHALGPELEANGVGMRSDGLVEQLSRR